MIPVSRIHQKKLLLLFSVILSSLMLTGATVFAQAQSPAQSPAPDPNAPPAPAHDPMDTEGLNPQLSRILKNYYRRTFTNLENWERLQSVTFEGILHLPEGPVPFTAHKKKPDWSKVVFRNPKGERIAMGYDGEQAWQSNFGSSNRPLNPMPEAEAKNFIRDASIGGHLLDPLAEGKRIELKGIIDVEERKCFELEVTLPDGQRILSAIDILEYAERQQITVNNVNGQEERFQYSDFRTIDGVRFPFSSTLESDGEVMHRVEMLEIRLNAGLIKSMFQPSSEMHSIQSEVQDPNTKININNPSSATNSPSFGESRFGESLFPESENPETDSSLDAILKRRER